jgi:hypothetical protein
MDPKLIDALNSATAGENVIFIKLGEAAVLCPIGAEAPIDPATIQAIGVEGEDQRRVLTLMTCSRVARELLSEEELTAVLKTPTEELLSGAQGG